MPTSEEPRQYRKITFGNREFLTPVPPLECPECGGVMVLRYAPNSPFAKRCPVFYGCAQFPLCRATHGAHPDGKPLGKPADPATKKARMAAHEVFDRLWKGPHAPMNRKAAYAFLRERLGLDDETGHISMFDQQQCAALRAAVARYYPGLMTSSEITQAELDKMELDHAALKQKAGIP